MWALLLLPIVLLVLYFAQRLLFRRLWDENLTVQISFDRDYIFCGEEANLVETIVNNKYLPLPVLEVGFDMSRWVVFQDEENSTVSDMTYRRDVFTASVRPAHHAYTTCPRQKARLLPHRVHHGHVLRFSDDRKAGGAFSAGNRSSTSCPRTFPQATSAFRTARSWVCSSAVGVCTTTPFEFAGIRDYRHSDPMKYINWKASARGGTLLVNQHDSTLSQKVTVLLDCTGIGSAVTDALNETAISIAAELAERMLADGISVSVISNGIDTVDGKMLSTGELTGRNTALYLRRRLAKLECRNDLTPMPQLLRTMHDGATRQRPLRAHLQGAKAARSAGFGSLNGGQ